MTTPTIDDEIINFQLAYQMLTKKQQKIFDYLHWFGNKFQVAAPSQTRIALFVGCRVATVSDAIKKFRELGLIATMPLKKGWSRLIYMISNTILSLDLKKPSTWFRRVKMGGADQNRNENRNENRIQVYDSNKSNLNDCENVQNSSNLKKKFSPKEEGQTYKNHEEMPPEMLKVPLPENDKKALWYGIKKRCKASFQDRVQALRLACEDFATYQQKRPIRNLGAFLTDRCKSHLRVS